MLFLKVLLLLLCVYISAVSSLGRLAKIHNDITYRMIDRVLDGKLSYLLTENEEADPFDNGRARHLYAVSERMRRALINELHYLPEEIDGLPHFVCLIFVSFVSFLSHLFDRF